MTGQCYGLADIGYLTPPAAPANLYVPSSSTTGSYTVSWTASSGASGYDLEEDTNSSFPSPTLLVNNQSVLSFNVTGRANGTYYYRVRSKDWLGNSAWKVDTTGCTVLLPPPPPAWITVPTSTNTGAFVITWASVSGASGYDLEESGQSGFSSPVLVMSNQAVTSFLISGKTSGTWYYRVRSINTSGAGLWLFGSNGCQILPPLAPANITVPANPGSGSYTVDWTASAGATGYDLEEDTSSSFTNPTQIYGLTNNSYNVTGKTSGTYWYRVRAYNLVGTSGWTTSSHGATITPPAAPTNLTVPPTSASGNFQVTWTASMGATGYDLEEANNSSFTNATLVVNNLNVTLYNVTGKTTGTWYYRVLARSAVGVSGWTNGSNGCTIVPPSAPPGIMVPTDSQSGNYPVTWLASPDTISYELQESTSSNFVGANTVYNGANTNFSVTGKSAGIYYYRVRAVGVAGASGWTVGTNGCQILPPNPPATITVPPTSVTGNYQVSWDTATGALSYELQESTSSNFTNPTIVYSGTNLYFNVTGKVSGTFYYRVCSVSAAGKGSWTTDTTGCTIIPPAAPGTISVPMTSSTGTVVITWSAPLGAVYFELAEDTAPGFTNPRVFNTGGSTSFTRIGLANGTYYYRVRAANGAGPSPWTTGPNGCTVSLTAPGAPASINVPAVSNTGNFMVDWSSVTGAQQYEVEQSSDPGFTATTVAFTGAATMFGTNGLADGTYYYRVRAGNTAGWSGWTTGSNGCVVNRSPSAAPSSITVPATSTTGNFQVTWGIASGATSYELEEDTTSSFANPSAVYLGSGTSFMVTGKSQGLYYYRVRGFNSVGSSAWTTGSNPCSVSANEAGVVVSAGNLNPGPSSERPGSTSVPALQARFTAGMATNMHVTSLTVRATGSGNDATHLGDVKAWRDLDQSGTVSSGDLQMDVTRRFTSDNGQVTFDLSTMPSIPAGQSALILVTFDIEPLAPIGSVFALYTDPATDVSAISMPSATAVTPVGTTVSGGAKTVALWGQGSLSANVGPFSPVGVSSPPSLAPLPIMQLILRASSLETVTVTGIRFRCSGSGNETTIPGLRLYFDANGDGRITSADMQVSTADPVTSDNGTIDFYGFVLVVPASGSSSLILAYDTVGASLGTYGVMIESAADITARGNDSNMAIAATGAPLSSIPVNLVAAPVMDPTSFLGCGATGFGSPAPLAAPLLALGAIICALRLKRRK